MKFNKEDFVQWKRNPVTEHIFKLLNKHKTAQVHALSSSGVIMSDNSEKLSARALGVIEALDLVLYVNYNDVDEAEEIQHDENISDGT